MNGGDEAVRQAFDVDDRPPAHGSGEDPFGDLDCLVERHRRKCRPHSATPAGADSSLSGQRCS
jgi:hypothetical protein